MPTLTLLDDAMLRAGRMAPAVRKLGGGTIAMAGSQQPWRVVGSEAVIYQLRQQSGRVIALRCLLSDTPEATLADRYRTLGAESTIKQLRSGGSSPLVGHISYQADGLSLPGSDLRSAGYPLIAMDWVMGATLISATDRACRSRDHQYLAALAQAWLTAMEALHQVEFVHGNLTGDNAMVRPREGIALVDYDTAFWPGAPWLKQIEARPGYRHPKGIPMIPERRDEFAALVIYTSLRLLVRWPELRDEHGDPASQLGGTLLFSSRDLANPDGSPLFGKIRVIDDPEAQALVAALREACKLRPDEGPTFLEVAHAAAAIMRRMPGGQLRTAGPAIPDETRERNEKLAQLQGYLLVADEPGALEFWHTSGLQKDSVAVQEFGSRIAEIERRRAPKPVKPAVDVSKQAEARKHWGSPSLEPVVQPTVRTPFAPVDSAGSRTLAQLRRALDTGDIATLRRLWPEMKGDPDVAIHSAPVNQLLAKHVVLDIDAALRSHDDHRLIDAVGAADASGVAVGQTARREARSAVTRRTTSERLEAALAIDDRDELNELALSGRLDEMGEFSPEVTRQIVRALGTPHLQRAVETDDDFAIARAYEQEIFGGISGVPDSLRNRVSLAVERVAWLATVRAAIKERDAAGLARCVNAKPDGVEIHLSQSERRRIDRLIRRANALNGLDRAIKEGSDVSIVDALNEIESSGAVLPQDLHWDAVRGVIDRLSLIASIRRVVTAGEIDYRRLARLLAQAREEAGGQLPYLGSDLDFVALEQDVWRAAHRARVREALKTRDDKAILAAALPDLYGAVDTLEPDERARVETAIARVRSTPALERATPAALGHVT